MVRATRSKVASSISRYLAGHHRCEHTQQRVSSTRVRLGHVSAYLRVLELRLRSHAGGSIAMPTHPSLSIDNRVAEGTLPVQLAKCLCRERELRLDQRQRAVAVQYGSFYPWPIVLAFWLHVCVFERVGSHFGGIEAFDFGLRVRFIDHDLIVAVSLRGDYAIT